MNKFSRIPLLLLALWLGACTTPPRDIQHRYDFGPLPGAPAPAPALPPLTLAPVSAPVGQEAPLIRYRLAYSDANNQQPYANSRWNAPPADLFEQRIKARIGQAGSAVLALSDGVRTLPVVKIEIDDFTHVFNSLEESAAHVAVRVSVIERNQLLAHQRFARQQPAAGANASAGAAALAAASDAVIGDILQWLAGLPIQR